MTLGCETPGVAELSIQGLTVNDLDFAWSMLYEAAFWRPAQPSRPRPPRDMSRSPELRRYLDGWGRPGDAGLVALAGGTRVGAAWYRLFPSTEHGYGYIDPRTPELTIAVVTTVRGRGVGRALLAALVCQAGLDGHQALSLSVEQDDPAMALYRAAGFEAVGRADHSMTMRLVLAA